MASMANYVGSASSLFPNVGKNVKDVDLERTRMLTTLPDSSKTAAAVLAAASSVDNRYDCVGLIASHYKQAQIDTLAGIARLARSAELRYLDRPTVLTPLRIDEPNIEKVLDAIIDDMYGQHSINGSIFAIGTITPNAANIGNGSIAPDLILDAVSQPCQRFRANRRYNGVPSELACVEDMKVTCIADANGQILAGFDTSTYGRVIEPNFVIGNELFHIRGKAQPAYRVSSNPRWGVGYGLDGEGSGPGPVFYSVNCDLQSQPETSLIDNRDFENWTTTNVPDNWVDPLGGTGGAASSAVFRGATAFTGSYSLQFKGDGTAVIVRNVPVDTMYLVGGQKYYLSIWIRRETGVAAGTVLVQFTGTGYTAASSEKITFAASGAAADTWVHYGAHIRLPFSIPSDWALKAEISGTLTSTKSVFFDDINFKPEPWHGGLSCPVYNGSIPPIVGDSWTFPITQSEIGVAQEFNKRWWGLQMPSSIVGAEDVADSIFV